MGNIISDEDVEQTYSLLPSGEYATTSYQNSRTYNSDRQWSEDAREVERLVRILSTAHYDRALKYYEEAHEIEIHRLNLSENHMSVAITNNNMGIVLNKLKRYEDAMEKYWESLRVKKLKLRKDHVNIAGTLHNMGVVHKNKKEYDMAMACYEEALRIRTLRLGLKATIQNMGIVHRERGESVKAIQLLEEALDINRLVLTGESIEVANVLNDLGKVYAIVGDYEQAMKMYREAREILDSAKISPEHVYMRENEKNVTEAKNGLNGVTGELSDEEDEESEGSSDAGDDFNGFVGARTSVNTDGPASEDALLDFVTMNGSTGGKEDGVEVAGEDDLLEFLSPEDNRESVVNDSSDLLGMNDITGAVNGDKGEEDLLVFPSGPTGTVQADDSEKEEVAQTVPPPVELPPPPEGPPPTPPTPSVDRPSNNVPANSASSPCDIAPPPASPPPPMPDIPASTASNETQIDGATEQNGTSSTEALQPVPSSEQSVSDS
eukprot:CAMPEP_0116041652 /NCGR_PEP_ID=MMETSP0321-20121206/25185_1 /TAXON_ID=163516 /ORGANISM="Leptocylindrus danicus var. danicus, Strain B650" /LENGTH=491 /DNA_ID=CAMNT_0003521905 /DNA_START=95 /DNA_END=1571 /DNA_ORIENTATION=-